jgi:hypothetical protein
VFPEPGSTEIRSTAQRGSGRAGFHALLAHLLDAAVIDDGDGVMLLAFVDAVDARGKFEVLLRHPRDVFHGWLHRKIDLEAVLRVDVLVRLLGGKTGG